MLKHIGRQKNKKVWFGTLAVLIACVLVVERKPIARAGFAPAFYVCLARYEAMNPITDARIEAKRNVPRFYYHMFNGVAEGAQGSGLPTGCGSNLYYAPNDPKWRRINQYNSVAGDGDRHTEMMDRCNSAAQNYAGDFNRQLATLRPDRLAHACRNE